MSQKHDYTINLIWTGNLGFGTESYSSYTRSHIFKAEGKPDLLGSSDPIFRGESHKWNPEELLLASLSACHMLWYLHLCADNKIVVEDYNDTPQATMLLETSGAGKFINAELKPRVHIENSKQIDLAHSLHDVAHQYCFIANSVNFPVSLKPKIFCKNAVFQY